MKEQLISFETAKLAKEKGFNIPLYPHYVNSNLTGLMQEESEIHNWNEERWSSTNYIYALAPTQSLLQKWLREKHELYVEVSVAMEFYVTVFHSMLGNTASNMFETGFGNGDKLVYEEALEVGLQEALKLIK